ncbi:MAG: Xaa-Pro dipeptidase [Pseudomonadota bacterium]|jgi:Xaa-Pro dipeptidase
MPTPPPFDSSALDALFPAHLAALQASTADALAATGFDSLVVGAGALHFQFLDDQPYPFKSNPLFRQWVPVLDAPNSFVCFTPGRKPTLVFLQPEDYWHKPPALPTGAWLDCFDVQVTRAAAEARQYLPTAGNTAYLGEVHAGLEGWGMAINPERLLNRMHFARLAKTPYELACMRVANHKGALAHRAAVTAFHAGHSEYAIHLAYLAATEHREEELPYPNIIALNEGGAILHYTDLSTALPSEHRSLLIDAGAQCRGYASDITRTTAARAGEFADLVSAMDELELALCAQVVPGKHYPEIHLDAHLRIARLLGEAGIIRGTPEAAVATGLSSVFMPHGIGHPLGLQVHDVGGFLATPDGGFLDRPAGHPYLRLTRTLVEGTVVTIEPGIYFIDLLLKAAQADGRGKDIVWEKVEALRPYGGVRVEDNVVATAGGAVNLTREAFAALG